MKIIIPVLGFGRAGGERVLSKLATELISCGHDVSFIAPDNKTEPYYETAAKIIRSEVTKSRFKIFRIISLYYNLWRKCIELKPDVVIASFHLVAYLVAALPIKRNSKFYYVQAYEVNFPESKIGKLIAYLTYHLPLKKILNSPGLLPQKIDDSIGIVPAGLDLDVFFARSVNCVIGNYTSIGLIGRKEKHKGTSDIISVLCALENKSRVIINVAVYLTEVDRERLITAGFQVNFVPILSDLELASFYRRNDIMIAVGLVEDGAFHYPCAESMASGCLVISNYAPLVETNSVLKLEKFNAIKLGDAINHCFGFSAEEKNTEIQANIKVLEKYDWKIVGKTFNFLLLEANK
ncbi:glycosyltransferase family 4 protein [Enterobacter mori]|uniref:Glycosyltransferase family 4 protein n=1 Tax=Enterobacter mori TaxID=539813 RepID=A0A7T0DTB5_9ENTR|nr:glycosyltransferase [Enterobacter mori]QPJ99037.1 glycosyltransferase family 4 protein [Enterobacter mori]